MVIETVNRSQFSKKLKKLLASGYAAFLASLLSYGYVSTTSQIKCEGGIALFRVH
jgi:hypothetical protein